LGLTLSYIINKWLQVFNDLHNKRLMEIALKGLINDFFPLNLLEGQ
jgi:hypothetical protein